MLSAHRVQEQVQKQARIKSVVKNAMEKESHVSSDLLVLLVMEKAIEYCGAGVVALVEKKTDTLTINVPGGVQQGQLYVSGKGNASLGNKDNGDLLLTVQIASHPVLERRGRDVYCEVPLLWNEAILEHPSQSQPRQLKSVFQPIRTRMIIPINRTDS